MESKKCTICLIELPIENFGKNSCCNDGYNNFCKICYREKCTTRYKNNSIEITRKICSLCKCEKDSTCFGRTCYSYDGLSERCKECQKLKREEIIKRNEERDYSNLKGKKICSKCKVSKSLKFFYPQRDKVNGFAARCIECERERCKKGGTHDLCRRNRNYQKMCNITMDDYNREFERQEGKCLICKEERELVVDHCHKSGKFRGLLCDICNRTIGMFKEDVVRMANAIDYIKYHTE